MEPSSSTTCNGETRVRLQPNATHKCSVALTDKRSIVLITRTSIVVLLQYVTHRAKLCKSIARY
jgi:hypothetical protein